MIFRRLGRPIGWLTVFAVVCTLSAVAGTGLVKVRFFDQTGAQIPDCFVSVRIDDGPQQKLPKPVNGSFDLVADPGQKVMFEVESAWIGGSQQLETLITAESDLLDLYLSADPTIQVGLEPNDLCDDAIGIASDGSTTLGSTVDATGDEPPAFLCGTSIGAPGVWYTVIGTGETLTATTCHPGTDYDTKLNVFCQDCVDPVCIDGNDDGSPSGDNPDPACVVPETGSTFNRASTVSWCSEAGATYRILVQGFGSNTGTLELSAGSDGLACTADVACLPPEATGACCDGLACSVETEADCGAAGGLYLGDDTECSSTGTNYLTAPQAPIPDNNPIGLSSTITADSSLVIADLDVDLVVAHSWVGDLIVTLTHQPSGTTATLIDRPGVPATSTVGCSSNNYDIILDDEGSGGPIEDLCGATSADPVPTSPPNYTPAGALSAFDGLDAMGDWTLTISDNAGLDTGVLTQWSLHINREEFCPVTQGGACCTADGCEQVDGMNECAGEYQGDGTSCAEIECPTGPIQVTLCHFPPGNPDNAQTITIGSNAVPAHLNNHGDHFGPCSFRGGLLETELDGRDDRQGAVDLNQVSSQDGQGARDAERRVRGRRADDRLTGR